MLLDHDAYDSNKRTGHAIAIAIVESELSVGTLYVPLKKLNGVEHTWLLVYVREQNVSHHKG
jgi:hypothetical protein